jgi:hypothetical protein
VPPEGATTGVESTPVSPEETTARVMRTPPPDGATTRVDRAPADPAPPEESTARVDRAPAAPSRVPPAPTYDFERTERVPRSLDTPPPGGWSSGAPATRDMTRPLEPGPAGVLAPPPRPARSTPGAALLGLSGLGAGFGYLGRWLPAVAFLVGTGLLVVIAYLVDASTAPVLWVVLLVLWLAGSAVVAGRAASRYPDPPRGRGRVLPVVAGVVLLAVLAAGFVGYRQLGASTYADGVAAQRTADCATAVPRFDQVTGAYRLTLSSDVAAAGAARTECQQFTAAGDAADRGNPSAAVAMYHDFRQAHPQSPLVGFARDREESTYLAWARDLRRFDPAGAIPVYRDLIGEFGPAHRPELADTYVEQAAGFRATAGSGDGTQRAGQARSAVEALLTVQREFADTPAAAQVVPGIADTYAAANGLFAAGQYCDGQPVLDYFAGLARTDQTAAVVDTANTDRATDMYECGLAQYNGSDYTKAKDQLPAFIGAYPNDARVAQARSVVIAATVLGESSDPPLPLPAPLTNNDVGPIEVLYYNNTPEEEHVYVAGPTAHEFVLPACSGCTDTYSGLIVPLDGAPDPCGDPAGKPSLSVRLKAGDYHSVAFGESRTTPVDTLTVQSGYTYTYCVYSRSYF